MDIKKVEDKKPRKECSKDSKIVKHHQERQAVKAIEKKEQEIQVRKLCLGLLKDSDKALRKQTVLKMMKNKPRKIRGRKLLFEESEDEEIALNKQKKILKQKKVEYKSSKVIKHQEERPVVPVVKTVEIKDQPVTVDLKQL